jgi:hypothetical protein
MGIAAQQQEFDKIQMGAIDSVNGISVLVYEYSHICPLAVAGEKIALISFGFVLRALGIA